VSQKGFFVDYEPRLLSQTDMLLVMSSLRNIGEKTERIVISIGRA
jgi:hypothetical protein